MGSEGWGGGCGGAVGLGGVACCGGGVGCGRGACGVGVHGRGLGGVCGGVGAVACRSVCCGHVCVGAVFRLARVAGRGVGLRLLPGGRLRLNRFRYGCHGHRRADHGRARDHAEQVVKGSFHSGASR